MIARTKYQEARRAALERLRKEKAQIDEYAAKPNANTKAVEIRRAALEALAEMIDAADAALAAMEKEAEQLQRQAYEMGQAEVQARWNLAANAEPRMLDAVEMEPSKEGRRALRQKQVMAQWPELYEMWKPENEKKR